MNYRIWLAALSIAACADSSRAPVALSDEEAIACITGGWYRPATDCDCSLRTTDECNAADCLEVLGVEVFREDGAALWIPLRVSASNGTMSQVADQGYGEWRVVDGMFTRELGFGNVGPTSPAICDGDTMDRRGAIWRRLPPEMETTILSVWENGERLERAPFAGSRIERRPD
ncbi:MAG: hypothetical protein AAF411_06435 [Myxococcota bacterium]